MNSTLNKPSLIFIIFCFCFSSMTMDLWRGWHTGEHNFHWDVAQYYAYLPAKFCNNNSFEFTNGQQFYLPVSPTGQRMSKFTYGMSLLYAPFFAMGYKIAINQQSPRDGYSEPFSTCIHWGSILYGLLGLILLRNFLIKYFAEFTVTLTLAICYLGTNLFYYVMGNSEMSHGYLFFLISGFLLATWHWYQKVTWIRTVLVGILIGLISLIRPTEILVGLIFIFWNVTRKKEFKEQMLRLWNNKFHLVLMALLVFLIWLPQLLFWKEKTGSYFFFSYVDEKFFWTDPQIINILFSYRKGWLVYSPLVALSFIGFFFMKGDAKKLRPVLLALLLLNIYILSCWWNWFYGGGFGGRCFTQHIAFLSLPLAACCDYFMKPHNFKIPWKYIQLLFYGIVFCGISLNLGQSYQFANIIIHPTGMSKETYWLVFGKYYLNSDNTARFWKSIKEADDKKLRSGEDRNQ